MSPSIGNKEDVYNLAIVVCYT